MGTAAPLASLVGTVPITLAIMRHFFIIFVFTLSGCETIWNLLNRDAMRKAMVDRFDKLGASVTDLSCSMLGGSRAFLCRGRMTEEAFRKLSRDLMLSATPLLRTKIWTESDCEDFAKSRETELVNRSRSEDPIKELPGLNYLVASFDPKSGEVCFESEYSYG